MRVSKNQTISVLLFAYRHKAFIEEALTGILSQTRQPDEVILCDDASNDGTKEILETFAKSSGRNLETRLIINHKNEGFAAILNAAFRVAKGDLWVIMAADDISKNDRLEKIAQAVAVDDQVMMVASDAYIIDKTSKTERLYFGVDRGPNTSRRFLASGLNGVLGATQAFRRELWDTFGEIPPGIYQEDLILPFRASLIGKVTYLPQPLVEYRYHGENLHFDGSKLQKSRNPVRDPEKQAKKISNYRAIVACRKADVSRARALNRTSESETKHLLGECDQLAKEVELESAVAKAGILRTTYYVARALFQGVRIRRIIRIFLQRHVTAVFDAYIRYCAGKTSTRLASTI
jgi:glycosyltransferase involved in cell wall biosynthesis